MSNICKLISVGDRFKTNYEDVYRFYLTRRTPVVVRIDGRAFHTFTAHNFNDGHPFSAKFMDSMVLAALSVANEMQGFKLGYIQSDEASFLLTDYDTLQTQPWFGYNKSKVESISASIMTAAFARCMRIAGITNLAMFDARAFNVPESEVVNYFLWRAKDWARNSVSMYARAHFSHAELHGKTCADMHEMLYRVGRNWANDLTPVEKNGTFIAGNSILENITPTYENIARVWGLVNPMQD